MLSITFLLCDLQLHIQALSSHVSPTDKIFRASPIFDLRCKCSLQAPRMLLLILKRTENKTKQQTNKNKTKQNKTKNQKEFKVTSYLEI